MRYTKFYLVIVLILSLIFTSCSEIQDEITPPEKVSVHGIDFMKKEFREFSR